LEASRPGTSAVERLESLVDQLSAPVSKPQRTRILVKAQARMILVDSDEIIYIRANDSGIAVVAKDAEGVSNYRTVEELAAALDTEIFWRPHRSYIVNINHIKEVVP